MLSLNAQPRREYNGLFQKQEESSLPKSPVAIVMPTQKSRFKPVAKLVQDKDNERIISGGWLLQSAIKVEASGGTISQPEFNSENWYNATVPGTVLTTLVDQGVYPDPDFGLNNLAIPDTLCRMDWWYKINFTTPEKDQHKKAWLILNGINYRAEVWLNGVSVGFIEGAFKRGKFDVTNWLNKDKENSLAIHILPPFNPGIPHEQSPTAGIGPNGGMLCMDGSTFIASEGWDWMPGIRDRNIGVWQDVRLKFTDDVILKDPQIITDLPLPDLSSADVSIHTDVYNSDVLPKEIRVYAKVEEIELSQRVKLDPGELKEVVFSPEIFPELKLNNPRLWWPNGYGKQELYNLELRIENDIQISDRKTVRFGIRELSYDLSVSAKDQKQLRIDYNPIRDLTEGMPIINNIERKEVIKGTSIPSLCDWVDENQLIASQNTNTEPYLVIKVNGQPIFCRGGNWGMDDMMKRVSREQIEPAFRIHQESNYNMIRNWTGESTEEVFYELCDEYGMLVWNDFWLSTQGANFDKVDQELFMVNATDVVKRFRNHPSIAIWCPRNEGYAPVNLENALAQMLVKEDGTRHYQGNSRYLSTRTSGPWHYMKNPEEYYTQRADGFSTELGTMSVPTAATIRTFMSIEDQWPISDTWYYHDFHKGSTEYLQDISEKYGEGSSLDDFCKKAQLLNYNSHRAMFESWNSKMWNKASGVLLWMTHPAWPSMIWTTYSSDFETYGSYFGAKKACEPIHIQMNLHDNKIVVINSTLDVYKALNASLEIFDITGKKISNKSVNVDAQANQLSKCFTAVLPSTLPPVYLVRLTLKDKKQILSTNEYWRRNNGNTSFAEFNELGNTRLVSRTIKIEENKLKFEITNKGKTPAIGLKFNLRNSETGKFILPALFTEGYFTLFPGEKKQIEVDLNNKGQHNVELVAEAYNMNPETILLVE